MARPEISRSGEIEVFVGVVEAGSFSAAARALHMTPSAVSKLIARLEARARRASHQPLDTPAATDAGRRRLPRQRRAHPGRPRCRRA